MYEEDIHTRRKFVLWLCINFTFHGIMNEATATTEGFWANKSFLFIFKHLNDCPLLRYGYISVLCLLLSVMASTHLMMSQMTNLDTFHPNWFHCTTLKLSIFYMRPNWFLNTRTLPNFRCMKYCYFGSPFGSNLDLSFHLKTPSHSWKTNSF